jgi:hypothetical protein
MRNRAFVIVAVVLLMSVVFWLLHEFPKPMSPGLMARMAAFQVVWNKANGKSLDFYGRVIDQYGKPVSGAAITGYVMKTEGFQGTSETPHIVSTDGEGNFQFTGLRGQSLGIKAEKNGYEFESRGNGKWSEDYKSNSDTRVIIKMWKIQGPEPLVNVTIHGHLECDGTPRQYNLRQGRKLPEGNDFIVTLTRNPVDIKSGSHFDWWVTFEIPNGGMVKIDDLYANKAPVEGYEKSVTFTMPADSPNWSPSLEEPFYFRNGNNYGRMKISVAANYQPPPAEFFAIIYLNPSGSRNLEFDPTKGIQ